MTTAPDYAVGPVHADSPEQVYQLAIDATKAIQDLRGIDANLKNDIAVTATELLHNAADHSRPEPGRPWAVHLQLIRERLQADTTSCRSATQARASPSPSRNRARPSPSTTRSCPQPWPASPPPETDDRGLGLSQVMELAKAPGRTLTITSGEAFLMLHEEQQAGAGPGPRLHGHNGGRHLPRLTPGAPSDPCSQLHSYMATQPPEHISR